MAGIITNKMQSKIILRPFFWCDVEGDNYKIRLLAPPLEVVFSGYLNRRGEGKREGDDGFIVGNVEELGGSKAFVLKGSELSVRPPVLWPCHDIQEPGRVGRKGMSSRHILHPFFIISGPLSSPFLLFIPFHSTNFHSTTSHSFPFISPPLPQDTRTDCKTMKKIFNWRLLEHVYY